MYFAQTFSSFIPGKKLKLISIPPSMHELRKQEKYSSLGCQTSLFDANYLLKKKFGNF